MSGSSKRVSIRWKVEGGRWKVEGRRCKTNVVIARSDAVSFWVEKPARFTTVEHGMAQKCLEDLQLGAASVEAICIGKRLRSSVPWAVYVLRAFLSSSFHSKTG